jgi:hypothetical protein
MSDEWIRELAEQHKQDDHKATTEAAQNQQVHGERLQVFQAQFPALWADFMNHLKRKVELYNRERGRNALTLELSTTGDPGVEVSYTQGDITNIYALHSMLALGELSSRVISRKGASKGDSTGDITVVVNNGSLSFVHMGLGLTAPEETADEVIKRLIR